MVLIDEILLRTWIIPYKNVRVVPKCLVASTCRGSVALETWDASLSLLLGTCHSCFSFLPPALAYYIDLPFTFHFFPPFWYGLCIQQPTLLLTLLLLSAYFCSWCHFRNFFLVAPHHSFSLFLTLCVSHPLHLIKSPPPSTESLAGSREVW